MLSLTKKISEHGFKAHKTIIRYLRKTLFPEFDKSLEEKLAEMNAKDPILHSKVDISLPPPKNLSHKEIIERKKYIQKRKQDLELERQSRKLLINPDMTEIRQEWAKSVGPYHIQAVAEHYEIYNHIFGDAYFIPYVIMNIFYPQQNENLVAPVCRGNIVKPTEAFLQPMVEFESDPKEFWTLTLVSPDGNLLLQDMECIHWFVGNIEGGQIEKGEVIWDYLPPFPPRGIGYQRLIFVLYKQEKKLDFSKLKKQIPCRSLQERNFKTYDFYKEWQDDLTPAGLSFFQTDWDKTSRKVFHEILNMEEPIYDYDFEPRYYKPQKDFPKKEPFDLYLDKFRDPRDINQEYLLRKLKETNPLEPPKPPFPYPKAIVSDFRKLPRWLKLKEKRYKSELGRFQDMQREEYE